MPVITVLCWGQEGGAPKNELGFGLGGLPSLSRSDAPSLNAGPRHGLLLNDGRRFLDGNKLALYGEINFLASPLHEVSSSVTPRDFYSGSPDYNAASLSGVQHNVCAGGAIVLRAALKWSLSS